MIHTNYKNKIYKFVNCLGFQMKCYKGGIFLGSIRRAAEFKSLRCPAPMRRCKNATGTVQDQCICLFQYLRWIWQPYAYKCMPSLHILQSDPRERERECGSEPNIQLISMTQTNTLTWLSVTDKLSYQKLSGPSIVITVKGSNSL